MFKETKRHNTANYLLKRPFPKRSILRCLTGIWIPLCNVKQKFMKERSCFFCFPLCFESLFLLSAICSDLIFTFNCLSCHWCKTKLCEMTTTDLSLAWRSLALWVFISPSLFFHFFFCSFFSSFFKTRFCFLFVSNAIASPFFIYFKSFHILHIARENTRWQL